MLTLRQRLFGYCSEPQQGPKRWWLHTKWTRFGHPYSEFFRQTAIVLFWCGLAYHALVSTIPHDDRGWIIAGIIVFALRYGVSAFCTSKWGRKGYYGYFAAEAAFLGASALHKAHQRQQERQAQLTADAMAKALADSQH